MVAHVDGILQSLKGHDLLLITESGVTEFWGIVFSFVSKLERFVTFETVKLGVTGTKMLLISVSAKDFEEISGTTELAPIIMLGDDSVEDVLSTDNGDDVVVSGVDVVMVVDVVEIEQLSVVSNRVVLEQL